jgi:valyl-tRNA synthetase
MLEKTYQPAEVEDRIYRTWEAAGAFDSGRPERKNAEPYCIVIPPPNVTGSLHMGHALNNTLQDILCRFERMRGKDVLWQPGTDHAGIATQMVVERQLMERQEPNRRAMGRDAFIKRVWEWKEESGGTIIRQLKRLGASCDWRRERFTMDEGLSRAVIEVFVALHKEGLIYRDKRLVNWDPKLLTAISDLEVQQVEVKGHLWYIKYPVEGIENTYITVATTRPETMLGDTAVAVHPGDERYKRLVGKNAILPLVGRKIPIVADEYSDPEKGSGAVKITPAHDFNDFEVWQRHKNEEMRRYPPINILSPEAKLLLDPNLDFKRGDPIPETFRTIEQFNGLDRFVARKKIVERLEELGLVEKIEPHTHMVPHGDRSGAVLEPFLTVQWYASAKELAKPALAAVKNNSTAFVPKNWEKTYFDWLEKIEPWCISRQLWWGHQIPAWYGPTKDEVGYNYVNWKPFVAAAEKEALAAAATFYGLPTHIEKSEQAAAESGLNQTGDMKSIPLWRDEDVLDTWFSSALWPFSTLGWPDKTPELKRYYPTSVLVTGFDIIFFWVARMMMMGLHFMKEIPFHTVYIHALVRDERGAKMSKSKGNVIDPLHLIDDYSADALRFTLAAMAAQGRDIKLATSRVEGYRNFGTKLWNAARFAEMNGVARTANFDPKSAKETLNRWILGEAARATKEVTAAIEAYKFNDAANAVYRFVWSIYCDWYIELAKPVLTGVDGAAKTETRATAAFVQDEILKLLHPFMPFLTEEIWQLTSQQGSKREGLLTLSKWPNLTELEKFMEQTAPTMDVVLDTVNEVRSIRATYNVPAKERLTIGTEGFSDANTHVLSSNAESISRLANIDFLTQPTIPPHFMVRTPVLEGQVFIFMPPTFDPNEEKMRLQKELAKVDEDIDRVDKKLNNAEFMARAREEVIDEQREKRAEAEARRTKISEALERLRDAV